MADNNNISIDIEINASGQQQLDQYKKAFDGLRTSINNLSNPITKLDSDLSKLTGSIDQLAKQNNSLGDSATKIYNNYFALQRIIKEVKEGMEALKMGTLSLEAALTGGLSVILAFLPEIINFTTALFK